MAGIAKKLPKGDYHIASEHSQTEHETHTLAWGLSHYVFDRYKTKPAQTARLLPIYVIEADDFPDWVKTQDKPIQNWLNGVEFSGSLSQIAIWPDKTGQPSKVFAGWGTPATRSRSRLHMAGIVEKTAQGRLSHSLRALPNRA